MNKEIEGEFVSNTCSLLILLFNQDVRNYNQISFIFGIINYMQQSTELPTYNNLISVITFSQYPLFYKLLPFSLTLPTGSVKSERYISSLRRVFNYKRTTIGLNRLGQMSLLAIESDILDSITNNDVINYVYFLY